MTDNLDSVDNTPSQAEKSDVQQQKDPIPYDRFSSVIQQKNAEAERANRAEAELKKYQDAEAERQRKKDEEDGNYQKIIADLEPAAKDAQRYAKVISDLLQTEIEQLPERWRGLVPDGDDAYRLDWIRKSKAAGAFDLPKAPPMDAGVTGDDVSGGGKARLEDLTPAQQQTVLSLQESGRIKDVQGLIERLAKQNKG